MKLQKQILGSFQMYFGAQEMKISKGLLMGKRLYFNEEPAVRLFLQQRGIVLVPGRKEREKRDLSTSTESKVIAPLKDSPALSEGASSSGASEQVLRGKPEPPLDTDKLFMLPTAAPASKLLANRKSRWAKSDQPDSVSFEDLPGPLPLKMVNKAWSFLSLVGTQLTVSSLHAAQFYLSHLGKRVKWLQKIRPYNLLFDEYGPVVRVGALLGGDLVIIRRAEDVRSVLKSSGSGPKVSALLDSLESYRKVKLPAPLPLTVLSGEGVNNWQNLRGNLQEITSFKAENFFEMQEQIADQLITKIYSERTVQEEVTNEFRFNMYRWGLECMSRTLFNERQGFMEARAQGPSICEAGRMLPAFVSASEGLSACETGLQLWRLFPTKGWSKLTKSCDVLEGFLCRNMRTAYLKLDKMDKGLEGLTKPTLLQAMILRDSLTPEQTLTKLLDLFLLGVNVAVNSVTFLLYHLAKHPRVQNKLYKEVLESLPKPDTKLNPEQFKKNKYMMACTVETLRLNSPFPFIIKILENDIIIHGYNVPKGTHLLMAHEVALTSEVQFEEPERFLPERWHLDVPLHVANDPLAATLFQNYLIQELIYQQICILTSKVVRHFSLEYHYGLMDTRGKFLALPDRPFRLRVVERAE